MSLESHLEKRRGTEAWANCQDKIVGVAKRTLGECCCSRVIVLMYLGHETHDSSMMNKGRAREIICNLPTCFFAGVMVFEAFYPSLNLTDELIQRISGIFDTNAIEIRNGDQKSE